MRQVTASWVNGNITLKNLLSLRVCVRENIYRRNPVSSGLNCALLNPIFIVASNTQKFINYTREAFFSNVHAVGAAAIGATTFAIAAGFQLVNIDLMPLLLVAGGAELLWLSAIANNPRFIRSVNAKYQQDIDKFYQAKTLVDYYNNLSYESQSKFDKLQKNIKNIREGFSRLNSSMPDMLANYGKKLAQMELAYVRLLYFKDRFPTFAGDAAKDHTIREIDDLNQELKTATNQRLRQIKEKRLKLLQMRMDNFQKVVENREIMDEQLQTMEEIVEYLKDQPMAINTMQEDAMIDNILFETEQTQQNLAEIESIMSSDFMSVSSIDDAGMERRKE